MTRSTKNILRIIFILAIASVIVIAVILLYYGLNMDLKKEFQTTYVVDPEIIVDETVMIHTSNIAEEKKNEDGTSSVFFSISPERYLTDDPGVYDPIDSTIIESQLPEYDYENTTNVFRTYLKEDISSSNFITYRAPDDSGRVRSVAFTLDNALDSSWEVDGNIATYREVYKGIDARYTILNSGILEELIVNNKENALSLDRIAQTLQLTGIYYKEHDNGTITFHDQQTKGIIYVSPRPVMYEFNEGSLEQSFGLHYEISENDNGSVIISKVIDEDGKKWMEKANYPIVIDNSYYGGNYYQAQGEAERSYDSATSGDGGTYSLNANPPSTVRNGSRRWGPPTSCSICPYSKWDYQHHLSFYTGDLAQPGGSGFDDSTIVGARLDLYMFRSGGVSGEVDYPEGNNLQVYSGRDVWISWGDPLVDPKAVFWSTNTMTDEGLINTTGLPTNATDNCFGSPASCKRVVDVDLGSICTSGTLCQTQFVLKPTYYYYGGAYSGIYSYSQASLITPPYPRLEIIYYQKPVISRVDPISSSTMEIDIDDDFDDETNYRLERSLTSSSGPWTEICTNLVTGGIGSCSASITYDCTGTSSPGTTGVCTITDDISAAITPNYSDKHVWYRARVERNEPPGDYISNSYSNIVDDYTLAAPPTDHPSATSETWDAIHVWFAGSGNEYSNQRSIFGSDPEPTKYCIGVYSGQNPGWYYTPTLDWRYSDDPPLSGSNIYVDFPDNTSGGLDVINNNTSFGQPRCLTQNEWLFGNLSPFNIIGEYSGYPNLRPSSLYILATYSQNTRNNTVLSESSAIINGSYVYTRARTPSSPNSISIEPDRITLEMNTTPHDNVTYVNSSSVQYAMQIQENGFWNYLSHLGGSARNPSATYQWGTYSDWGGVSGEQFTGLQPGTCYNFRAQSRNNDGIIGESDAEVWSPIIQYCTPLNPPNPPTVDCNYDVNGLLAMEDLMQYYAVVTDEIKENNSIKKKSLFNISTVNAQIIELPICGNGICELKEDINNCPADCGGSSAVLNDYYCQVGINPANTGTLYYNVQRRYCSDTAPGHANCTSGAWTNLDSVGNEVGAPSYFLDPGTTNHLGLLCQSGRERYDYQVRVSRSSTGTSPSAFSGVSGDYLPPCPPEVSDTPSAATNNITETSIIWSWGIPDFGESIGSYQVYRRTTPTGTASTFISAGTGTTYNQVGLSPNSPHYLEIAGIGSDTRTREGAISGQSSVVYTLADNPTISVNCNYDSANQNNCKISLINHNNNTSENSPQYCLSRKNGSNWDYYNKDTGSWLVDSIFSDCPNNYFSDTYNPPATDYDIGWSMIQNDVSGTPFTCNTFYTYRMQAKNGNNIITSNALEVSDTTPACPPYNLGHNNNTISGNNYYINWTWTNADNTLPIDIYENNNSCSGTKLVDNLTPGSVARNIYWSGAANVEKAISICYDQGADVYGQPATASAFTRIQNPTGISLNTSSKDQITVNRTSTLSNVDSFRDSVAYYYNAAASNGGTGGSNSGWIDDGNDLGGSWTDNGLQTNYKYCYRILARNNQNTTPPYSTTTEDISSYSSIACIFTYAEIPKRPIRSQVDASTVNIIIRDSDGNPHGPLPVDDTNYAICVTEYNMDGSINQEGYVQSDNTISWLAAGLKCGDNGDQGVIWNTRSGWGGDSGVDITGVISSTKFGFSIKARNGDGINTNFGPEATLFLVRNNVVGWAWSSNIGWVSMNCLNLFSEPSLGFSCKTANNWGINTSFEPTRQINPLEGYAWSASGQAKSLGSCEINNIGQSCNNNSDCGAGGACTGPSIGVKTGLGWISFNKSVCSNDPQQGCIDDNECTGVCVDTPAEEISEDILVAGDTPDSITYGFCYNDTVANNGEKYGVCSDNGADCTETNVLACADPTTATCILATCKTGDTCPADASPGVKECRPTATASFNGETREIEGWARILSQKEQGESYSPPFTDWGWLKLGGQYDDGQGNTGNYNLTGTEIDSQLFLGDPDVSPDKLSLYTFFGWGWNAAVADYSTTTSNWLAPALVSKNLNYTFAEDWEDVSMVIDSNGNPHLAWSQYNATNGYFDIYYAKLEAGRWVTITGEEYQSSDQNFNANTSNLDVSYNAGLVAAGVSSRFPSLVLDSSGLPHIAGQYGTYTGGSSVGYEAGIFYTYWNGSAWQSYSQVQEVPASTPSLALSSNNTPYIAYRYGGYLYDSEIYLEVWNGDAWNTITDDGLNLSVSKGAGSSSNTPRLKINNDIPYVVWQELFTGVEHIFYRWWNGSDWVSVDETAGLVCSNDFTTSCTVATESTDCGTGQCISESTSVNWGILTCGGGQTDKKCYDNTDCVAEPSTTCDEITTPYDSGSPYGINSSKPDLDFFSNGNPGIVFNNANKIMFRRWNGTSWSDIDGGVPENLQLNKQPFIENTYYEHASSTNPLVIDSQDQPHIVFTGTEIYSAIEGQYDLRYLYWDNGLSDWTTADKISPHEYDDSVGVKAFVPPTFNVSNTAMWKSQSSTLSLDRWGNPYIGWIDTQSSGIGCDAFGTNGVIDGIDGEVHDIAVDRENNVIYLAGVSEYDITRGDHWRIDKRRFDNGDLTTDFGWYENPSDGLYTSIQNWDNGIIVGDTHSREAWNMEMDKINNHLYIIGRDWSGDDWRLEKRYMDSGDRVAGFGNADDTNWPDAPAGVVRMGYGTVVYGIDMQIDNNYIYIAGNDDNTNWRIEKRSKLTGDLVAGFGGSGISDINTDPAGVITSIAGEDVRKIIIDELYMWVIGRDANDWRIEKRLLSNGSLVSSFGANGVFTGSSSNPDSHSIYDVVIDGDYIYVAGRTNNNNWLIGKLNKNTAALDTNFDTDGYVEVASGDYIYGIEISGNDIITAGRTGNDWHYEIRDKNTGNINPLTFTNGWQNGEITSADGLFVWGMSSDDDYMYAFGYDDYDTCIANVCSISGGFCNTTAECPDKKNWRLERRWKSTGVLDNSSSVIDCKDPNYQTCNWVSGGPSQCIGSNLMFTRWSPGRVQNGLGWVEFMPAGALLGIPWVQTAYADIYGTTGVSLAPPPRGSGEYSATYLILSNGNIQGIPTFYSGDTSQQPTTQFYEGGLNPLIEGSGLPFGENSLSKINVDALVADNGNGFNRYGHKLVSVASGDLATNLGVSPVLDGAVYYINGNATIDSEIKFTKGDSLAATETLGNGLIVVDGDLEINANTLYDSTVLNDITEMPSVGFIVRGNIYINPFVTKLSGAFVALDNPTTTNISEGIISTSRKAPVAGPVINDLVDENDVYVTDDLGLYTLIDGLEIKFGQETSDYKFRQKISFASMADLGVVNNFPLLVNINTSNTDFWNSVNTGANPRNNVTFVDANGVSLNFHFEKFESINLGDPINDAIAWVKVPELITDGNDYIYMYYDDGNSIANAENQPATYDDNFKAVYHLDETGTGTRFNSTQYSHDGTPVDYEGDEGVSTGIFGGADQMDGEEGDGGWREGLCIGGASNGLMCTDYGTCVGGSNPGDYCTQTGGQCLGGGTCDLPSCSGGTCDTAWEPTGDYIDLGPDIISGNGDFTTEAWVKLTSGHYNETSKAYTIVQQQDNNFGGNGTYLMQLTSHWLGTKIFNGNTAEWLDEDRNNDGTTDGYTYLWSVASNTGGNNYDDNNWHYVVMTQENSIQGGRLYIDGVEVDYDSMYENTDDYWGVAKIDGNNRSYIGATRDGWYKFGGYFNGTIDEVRISDVARTPDFIKASYRNGLWNDGNNTNDIIDIASSWTQEIVGNTTKMSRAFLRWSIGPSGDLDIPPGSEIRNAYLNLYGTGVAFGNIEGRIYLMDESDNDIDSFDSATYSIASNLYNVSTSNSVKYNSLISEWDNNGVNKTPDIKSLVSRFINSDEYEQNYHDGFLTHIGLSIQEDTSTIGGQRNIYSSEDTSGNAPELVVEYSPRRTYLQVENINDDIGAWGSLPSDYQSPDACLNFGWSGGNPNRIFYRFVPDSTYTPLPDNAEVMEAHLRAANSGCSVGVANGFQMRQGLLDYDNYPPMTVNPYDYLLTQDVFEVSEDIATGIWTSGETYVLRDISTLIQSWVDRAGYTIGNSVGLRLRRDNNTNELVAGVDEYRAISQQATTLEVDYLVPLQVSGLFVAKGYNFDRKYTKDLAPAERIMYDGRVVANTPPGLADFSKALPIYQRVAP